MNESIKSQQSPEVDDALEIGSVEHIHYLGAQAVERAQQSRSRFSGAERVQKTAKADVLTQLADDYGLITLDIDQMHALSESTRIHK